MAGLQHIHGEPAPISQVERGSRLCGAEPVTTCNVIRDKWYSTFARNYAFGHGIIDWPVILDRHIRWLDNFVAIHNRVDTNWIRIATQNPYDSLAAVACRQPTTIGLRTTRSKYLLLIVIEITTDECRSPNGKHCNAQFIMRRTFDRPVYMLEILWIGSPRIVLDERKRSVAVRDIQAICRTSHRHGLDNCKTFFCPVHQVLIRFLASQTHQHRPTRVSQPKKRLPVRLRQVVAVGTHTYGLGEIIGRVRRHEDTDTRQCAEGVAKTHEAFHSLSSNIHGLKIENLNRSSAR